MPSQQHEQEDCPICCSEMSPADQLYGLHCPTATCSFNYCSDCIVSMQKSASEGYQMASDGSRQVKVKVMCPQCRSKYSLPDNKSKYPSDVIIKSVLVLRRTHEMQSLLRESDSNLTASELAAKDRFVRKTSMESIEDAVRRLDVYHKEIGKPIVVPPPDYAFFKTQLQQKLAADSIETANSEDSGCDGSGGPPWKDPTLFCGLDELMTDDEQEFISHLLVSGKVELLLQAALILHGILFMNRRDCVVDTVNQLSNFGGGGVGSGGSSSTTRRRPSKSKATIALHQRVRNRYPLPARMPRAVSLPVYHPEHDKPLLNFKDKAGGDLVLKNVRGPAGQLGLRKGDVVTHVGGEPVHSQFDFTKAMIEVAEHHSGTAAAGSGGGANGGSTVLIVVNADEESAAELRDRATKMQQDNIRL